VWDTSVYNKTTSSAYAEEVVLLFTFSLKNNPLN
jgi:hypothetical protein